MYLITYIGMDKLEHVEEENTLEEAKKLVTFLEERGAHSIEISKEEELK